MADYEIGYKRPPKHYQFGQPGGNKPGESSEMRKRSLANAQKALELRGRILDAALAQSDGKTPEEILELLDAAMNTMLKDSENRGMGMPSSSVNLTSDDGSMSPSATQDAVMAALKAKHKE